MACTLYREGKGTIEHGIECESTTCEVHFLESMLASGWSVNPPGYEPPAPDDEGSDDEDGVLDPVRIQAREAGIEGWDTKRITTLKKALEA